MGEKHVRAAVRIAVCNRDVEKSAAESVSIITATITPYTSCRPWLGGFERDAALPSSRHVARSSISLVEMDIFDTLCPVCVQTGMGPVYKFLKSSEKLKQLVVPSGKAFLTPVGLA